jgi:hypothetical protein
MMLARLTLLALAVVRGDKIPEVAKGLCNDKSPSCAAWAKNGECTGEVYLATPHTHPPSMPPVPIVACSSTLSQNAEYLLTLCAHSCGTCTMECEDTDVSCSNWAKNGDCSTNAGFMLKACPTSCGLCTPTCKDMEDDCESWRDSGACSDNPEYMHKYCESSAPRVAVICIETMRVILGLPLHCPQALLAVACAATSARTSRTIAQGGHWLDTVPRMCGLDSPGTNALQVALPCLAFPPSAQRPHADMCAV